MKPRMVLTFVSCLFLMVSPMKAQPLPAQDAGPYSNSTDGLQKLVWDMVAAEKSGGDKALVPYVQSLALPDSATWFSRVFGEGAGQQLAVFYDAWTEARNSQLGGDVGRAIALQMTDVAALSFARPGDTGTTDKDNYFLGLAKQPQTFYVVNFKSENGSAMRWAFFVYDEGAFRYLGPLADLRLAPAPDPSDAAAPTAMPRRIHLAGNVADAHAVHRVLPVYPPTALTQRLEGAVDVHTTVAPDGTVEAAEATSGNPVFVSAAETAVRQWKFAPVLLNGEPVTVDTTITINFHLPPTIAGIQPGASGTYAPIPSYPESPSGLTKMMKQMLALFSQGKSQELDSYYHALAVPNPDAWFAAQFGDRDGTRFAENYQRIEQSLPLVFTTILQTDTGLKYDTVDVMRFRDACTNDANDAEYPILVARAQQTTALYEVRFMKNGGYRWLFPFAYVDGGFRYLGELRIQAPPNNLMGTNIQPPKLLKEVQATYPMGVNMPGNTGSVQLWGIVSADGSVRDLHVIQGSCPYVKATIDAVKKWRFTPLMVDGKPQDMVYPFNYSFGLNR